MLDHARQLLKEAEDPNSNLNMVYRSNFEDMLNMSHQGYLNQLQDWQKKYPEDKFEFIKVRLNQFLEETAMIDFSAELIQKGDKMIFSNSIYESKSKRWKLAFRAGKEVIEPARTFVQKWVDEW